MFRNVTLKCLTEIAGVTVTNYDDMFTVMFTHTMAQLEQVSCVSYISVAFVADDGAVDHRNMWPN